MSALGRLLGTREIEMHHAAMSEPVTGRQRFERVLDAAFVLLHGSQTLWRGLSAALGTRQARACPDPPDTTL